MTLSVAIFNTNFTVDRANYNTSMNIVSIHNIVKLSVYSILKTGEEFDDEENKHLGEPPFNFSRSLLARFCHDATWALAWSLHKTIKGINL